MAADAVDQWLPVLDIGPFLAGERGGLEKLAQDLCEACETVGFYFLENYESILPASVCRGMLDATAQGHMLPEDVKEKYWLDASDSGYMPQGATTRWGSSGRPKLPEHDGVNEAMLYWGNGPPWAEKQLAKYEENNLITDADLPEFKRDVGLYYTAIEKLAHAMLPAYALALEQRSNYFDEKFLKPCWALRLNWYPPTNGKDVGIPPHADGDFCTYLLQDDQSGLSLLRSTDNKWVMAPAPAPYSLLVNSGNTLMRLSNDKFPSTMHSASCLSSGPGARARKSVAFFWSPSVDVEIEPLDAFISDERPATYAKKQSGNCYSSGRVGHKAKGDKEREDARADTFEHPLLSKN